MEYVFHYLQTYVKTPIERNKSRLDVMDDERPVLPWRAGHAEPYRMQWEYQMLSADISIVGRSTKICFSGCWQFSNNSEKSLRKE